ncbi:MAG TPA: hypothetical protein VF121_08370 [Thermoanaerobaculia bacterium]|nr:hypothetical protein [Thermoanaerobaculia bacterium]
MHSGKDPESGARGRGLAVALLFCSVVAGPFPAAAQDPTSPFPDIKVDLSGRLFTNVLPFDVPFLVNGEVPLTTQRVDVRYVGHSQSFRVAEPEAVDCPPPATPVKPRCFETIRGGGEREFGCNWQPASGGPISWTQELEPPAGAQTLTFRVPVPPLESRSYYVFKFEVTRELTDADVTEFRTGATTALDELLREIQTVEATPADNERLRARLVRELQGVACPGLRITSDNLFNLAIPYPQLADQYKLEWNRLVGEVLNAQDLVTRNIRQRSGVQPQLENELDAIAASDPLDKLIRALKAQAATGQAAGDSLLNEFMTQHQEVLRFADLGDAERANVSLGVSTAGPAPAAGTPPPPPFDETIDAAAAGQYAANYRTTQRDLGDLQEWLDGLVNGGNRRLLDEAVATGAGGADGQGLTDDDVEALETVLGNVDRARRLAAGLANFAEQVQRQQAARTTSLTELVNVVRIQAAAAGLIVDASTLGNFKTQQSWYIAADFGFALAPEVDKAIPYIGTNIYFRPVNKDAPLRDKGGFGRRFAVSLGLTVKSIADESPQTRDDLFDSNSLLFGAGLRLTDSGRLGVGALVFEERDPNPLVNRDSLTFAPYISLSFDWDILEFFKGFSGLFPTQPPG